MFRNLHGLRSKEAVKEMLLSTEHLLHWRKTRKLQVIICFVQRVLI